MFIELVSLGTVNETTVKAPEVFRMGIYKLAVKMILVHHHPSGTTKPSPADMDLTDHLMKAGTMLEIEVIDHLIIAENAYYSFADNNLLEELRESGLYELRIRESEALLKMKEAILKDEAAKENSIQIAKRLKALGMDVESIKKATKLGKREIDKL